MKHKKTIIGVIGSYHAADEEKERAESLGALIAKEGWVTLTGGEPSGVMEAASKGAKEAGGLVVGILPETEAEPYSEYIDIPIFTNAAQARNYYNVLSSDMVIVSSQLSSGTLRESLLALTTKTPVVVNDSPEDQQFLVKRGGEKVTIAQSPEDAIDTCKKLLSDE